MSEPIKVFITQDQWRAYLEELKAREAEEEEEEDIPESSDIDFIDDSEDDCVDDEAEFVGVVESSEEDTDWTESEEDFIET
jgi:hypothetical protein